MKSTEIYEIEITDQAEEDLNDIFAYIAYEKESPANADSLLKRLEEGIMSLDRMPERYRTYDRAPFKNREMRIMPIDSFCVFYHTNSPNLQVTILRVLYQGRDLAKEL